MRVSKIKELVNLETWKRQIADCIESGLTNSEWCKQNHVSEAQYYYRLKKVQEAALEEIELNQKSVSLVKFNPSLLEMPSEEEHFKGNRITVRYGETTAEIPMTSDISIVARLMKELAQ